MKPRNVMLSLLVVCGLLLWAVLQSRHRRVREAFDRHPPKLQFAAVALCRMRCLDITAADVAMAMENGLVLYHRSNRRARPCPVWVVQGKTAGRTTCRIRLEQCAATTVVVGVERIDGPVSCACTDDVPVHKKTDNLPKNKVQPTLN